MTVDAWQVCKVRNSEYPFSLLLKVPPDPIGVVIIAPGLGSGHESPRNAYLSTILHAGRIATVGLQIDDNGSSPSSETARLLATFLEAAIDYLIGHSQVCDLGIGILGSSLGGAAAVIAAANSRFAVRAVVLRGARLDLAEYALAAVRAPALLMAGGKDFQVKRMNEAICVQFGGLTQLKVIEEASHLFEEPGAIEAVAQASLDWFKRHLPVRKAVLSDGPDAVRRSCTAKPGSGPLLFKDRTHAGRLLGEKLRCETNGANAFDCVVGIARGGLVVAHAVAAVLNLPLDLLVVRKLGIPGMEEHAMGAVTSSGNIMIDNEIAVAITQRLLDSRVGIAIKECRRLEGIFRAVQIQKALQGKRLLLVDDGIASGCTVRAAISELSLLQPQGLSVATPVGLQRSLGAIESDGFQTIALLRPKILLSVSGYYANFVQITEDMVCALLTSVKPH